jgi:hypothetical protein
MPAISGSIFRRTVREQHLAQKYKAGKPDSHVVPMVQVCFCAVHPLIFPFTLSFLFPEKLNIFGTLPCRIIFCCEHLRVVTAHKRPPSRAWTSLWALNGVRFFRSFPPHFHSHFISHFSLVLIWTFITSMRTAHPSEPQPCRALHPDAFPYGFVAASGNCVVPGSSCSVDVVWTWAACAPTSAKSISFCLLRFYGLHIGPAIFCFSFRSIFTSFSARYWTSPCDPFTSLASPACYAQLSAAVFVSTFLAVHWQFSFILALIPFRSRWRRCAIRCRW